MSFRKAFAISLCGVLLLTGCGEKTQTLATPAGERMKIRVGYIGITCEAPIYSAVENGFFKEEGLDVELVKCEWANYKDVLALGGYDRKHPHHRRFAR
jgi:NitT/TauT family transport system substrate-binding protein